MNPSIKLKLQTLTERLEEVGSLLSDPDTMADQNRFRDLSREYAEIDPVVKCYERYEQTTNSLSNALEMREDPDPEMRELADEEAGQAQALLADLERELQILLLPADPSDESNIFLEIRAGTSTLR